MARKKTSNIVLETAQHSWKKRPSEIRGYQRTFYINSEDGDYLRVDYNLKEKRVRLYIEIEGEGGNAYYSVITSGKITAERSVSTGRNFGFADKFRERAEIFSTMPNREVLKLINRNYGIQRIRSAEQQKAATAKEKLIRETKRRYFRPEDAEGAAGRDRSRRRLFGPLRLIDIIDIALGLLIAGSVFIYFRYSYMAAGAAGAFFGIIIGLVDMFFRERSPNFIKVIVFLLGGIALYVRGYLY